LKSNLMLRFALVRAAEIFGEAASKVSVETRASAPSIPWREIVSMRNRLIHAYFDIDHDVLWKAATEEIPTLSAALRAIFAGRLRKRSRWAIKKSRAAGLSLDPPPSLAAQRIKRVSQVPRRPAPGGPVEGRTSPLLARP
jgi:uncharacterized protein with HEPN domain